MRRKIVAIGAGFCLWAVSRLLIFLVTVFAARRLGPSGFGSFVQSINPIITLLNLLVYLVSGLITGWIARDGGWLYGGMVAMPIVIPSWIGTMVSYFAPAYVYGPKYINKYKPGLLFSYSFLKLLMVFLFLTCVTLFIFGLGGWIGEKLYKRRVSKQA